MLTVCESLKHFKPFLFSLLLAESDLLYKDTLSTCSGRARQGESGYVTGLLSELCSDWPARQKAEPTSAVPTEEN